MPKDPDFLGEGTYDPSTAFLSPQTPEQIAADKARAEAIRRQNALRASAAATSTANVDYGQQRSGNQSGSLYVGDDAAAKRAQDAAAGITGRTYRTNAEQKQWQKTHQRGLGGNLIRDPLTLGVLLAPAAVTGAGLALGAGAGAAAGGAAAAPGITTGGAVTGGTMAAPAAAGGAVGASAPFTMASPFAAGGAAAAGGGVTLGQGIAAANLAVNAGTLIKGQMDSAAEKALVKKQEQMAQEAAQRRQQVQQEGMNRLGQSLLAFNPQNQMMAQMFGPGAAFTPQQMGQMAADPGAMSDADYHKAWQQSMDSGKPMQGVTGDDLARREADRRRQQMVQQGTQAPGPGPTPLQQRAPQAGRRY